MSVLQFGRCGCDCHHTSGESDRDIRPDRTSDRTTGQPRTPLKGALMWRRRNGTMLASQAGLTRKRRTMSEGFNQVRVTEIVEIEFDHDPDDLDETIARLFLGSRTGDQLA